MHQDRNRVVIPNMDHIVKNINDLMCCANCGGFKTHFTPKCMKAYPYYYCDKWFWDKHTQQERSTYDK